MENLYKYKYLKYKNKYLKLKYGLEGSSMGFFKSKIEKAMDKVYDEISQNIMRSGYSEEIENITTEKQMKAWLKKKQKKFRGLYTKNPLIDNQVKEKLKNAQKKADTFKKSLNKNIKDCKEYSNDNAAARDKHLNTMYALQSKLANLEINVDNFIRLNSKDSVDFKASVEEVAKFKTDKEMNVAKFKKLTKFKDVSENELNLYIEFWIIQSKFYNHCIKMMDIDRKLSGKETCDNRL